MAGVPPVELFVKVQEEIAPLKLSERTEPVNAELEVALDVKLMELPLQMLDEEAEAVTEVGVGFTVSVLEADTLVHDAPVVVSVNVTSPV